MEKNLRGLRNLTYMSLAVGVAGFALFYFMKFHFGIRDMPVLVGGAALTMLGCCCSLILKSLKVLDARLTQIEKSNR